MDYGGLVDGKMCLIVIDVHPKWIKIFQMPTTTSFTTFQQLSQLFAEFGIPESSFWIIAHNLEQFHFRISIN